MLIFVGKVFTSTAFGRRLETVICEKCSTRYHYVLSRIGIGQGSAAYLMGQQSASNRAMDASRANLAKRLNREAELVPCPRCHWVNEDLIQRHRKTLYRRAPKLMMIVGGVLFLAGLLISTPLFDIYGYNSKLPGLIISMFLWLALISPVVILLIRRNLRMRVDPNHTYPGSPQLPLGTPPALVEKLDPKSGQPVLEPVANQPELPGNAGEWAVFRPGQIFFPPVCCFCLSQATKTYTAPFKVSHKDVVFSLPLCAACSKKLMIRWCLAALFILVVTLGGSGLLVWMIPGGDAFGHWMMFCILGLFAGLFGVAMFPNWICRPYRSKVVDSDRGIVKLAVKNQSYTDLLIEQARAVNAQVVRDFAIDSNEVLGVRATTTLA
jgi:hypothetical protein